MLGFGDTIAAVATPPGYGGVAIVRISGPGAFAIADRLFDGPAGPPSGFATHTIHHGLARDPATRAALDDVLLLAFRAPRSYTGEDVVELSCHGGPLTVAAILGAAERAGARPAEPGEFTCRAFVNGRMDLAQAEAVCDLIRSRTEAARRVALRQRDGELSHAVAGAADELTALLAAIEASIDFGDEVGDVDRAAALDLVRGVRSRVDALLATAARGRALRDGARLAIVGRPNVGKSSLMNALLRADRVIVTPVAGTTRDAVEESAAVGGVPVTVVDTAGLRDSADAVERMGVERARAAAAAADVLLFVVDAVEGWTADDDAAARSLPPVRTVWIANKCDLVGEGSAELLANRLDMATGGAPVARVSALTGAGIEALEDAIGLVLLGGAGAGEAPVVVASERHARALSVARESLSHAVVTGESGLPIDLITVDVRGALEALGQITGATASNDVIARVFRDFCVGK
ncbi:MAG: tRNA uridine-5-carboxymethylaminomethyl(34) synthesis GTPase MnmE [Chthonomonadales bacterium]|nr:tRNA uridine-5-carboxymethylaminomethyl(34) synthesis GTPase MnmE [Chthonomonadales bacterium]